MRQVGNPYFHDIMENNGTRSMSVVFFPCFEACIDDSFQGESILAYGTVDGSIGAVKLTQRLSQPVSSSELFKSSKCEISLIAEQFSSRIHEPDHSGITALQWIGTSDHDVGLRFFIFALS